MEPDHTRPSYPLLQKIYSKDNFSGHGSSDCTNKFHPCYKLGMGTHVTMTQNSLFGSVKYVWYILAVKNMYDIFQ